PTTPLISLDLGEVLQRAQVIRGGAEPEDVGVEELFPKSTDEMDPVSVDLARQIQESLERGDVDGAIAATDALRRYEFAAHAQDELQTSVQMVDPDPDTVERAQDLVRTWEERTRQRIAILYTLSYPDRLELLLITRDGEPVHRVVPEAGQLTLSQAASEFRQSITNPLLRSQSSQYLPAAQQLYDYVIRPVEERLKLDNIDSVILSLSPELRSTPIAALHDGEQYFIENYNFTLLPSFDAIDSKQQLERGSGVLALGASQFEDPRQNPLPFVPVELETITQKSWQGQSFLDESFTLENFLAQRQADPDAIVHLATHAEFRGGSLSESYIQFGRERIGLNDLERLQLDSPTINLLVLSACRTALGKPEAELGFAGLSVQAGVRTAIASLWYVDDAATSVLMGQFYRHWADGDIATKSAALQQAQVAVLTGQATIKDGNLMVKGVKG
ncbi:MAG: CHAT domain-containing protein, partial [Cyanobacteria bacterium P01_H01_bin.130]